MKPSSFQTTIENQFDYICKRAMEDERNLASPKGLVYDKIVLSRIKALSIKERSKCHVRKKT